MKCQLINKPIDKDYLNNLLLEKGVEDLEAFLKPTDDLIQSPEFLDNIKEGWELLEKILYNDQKILLIVD